MYDEVHAAKVFAIAEDFCELEEGLFLYHKSKLRSSLARWSNFPKAGISWIHNWWIVDFSKGNLYPVSNEDLEELLKSFWTTRSLTK